jgi:phosphoribosylformylglycinamidine synthase
MSTPRALVLRTAGINCDGETVRALELAGAEADLLHLKRVLSEPARLDEYELIVIPGGFSYGDDVAAGRVFGLELRSALGQRIAAFVERGGFVLGVCNGFQVLVEAGLFELPPVLERDRVPERPLVPERQGAPRRAPATKHSSSRSGASGARSSGAPSSDLSNARAAGARNVALYDNASNRFECRWISIEAHDCAAVWLAAGERMPVPIAHGEGRFVVRDAATLQRLKDHRQIAFRYVRSDGSPAEGYPDNPNGSVEAIAGICDPTGRVLGLMPHPERNITPWNHPCWTRLAPRSEGEGLGFYRRLVEAASGAPV